MEDYKPNSQRYKKEQQEAEKKKVQKVISGKATVHKKSEMRKIRDNFISEDAKNVKSYVLIDVLVPAIKKAVSDIVTDGIHMILYGEAGRKRGARGSGGDRTPYRSYYDDRRDDYRPRTTVRRDFNLDDIGFESRGDAEDVIIEMRKTMDDYGLVTVGDLYEMAGLQPPAYTANKYGWTSMRGVDCRYSGGDWILVLPKPMAID